MLEKFLKRVIGWCERTGRVEYITGTTPKDIYLIRYLVVNRDWLKVYIHIFLRSDRDDPHDHPWDFWTRMVRGTYKEELFQYGSGGKLLNFAQNSRSCSENAWVRRKATDVHRIRLRRSYQLKHKDDAPMTLFFAGARKRPWGFIKNGRWISWKTYLGIPEQGGA